jgi:hypothetical protein
MKAYLAVTAGLFGLLTVIHLWRMIEERRSLATDPWFLIITLVSALLCAWGLRLFLAVRHRPGVSA